MAEASKMPETDEEWVLWGENFVLKSVRNESRDEIPPKYVLDVQTTFTAFKAGVILASGPDSTPVIVEQKNEDRALFEDAVRLIVNFLQQHSQITNAQRKDYGINVWDKIRSKSTPIHSHVVLEAAHTQSGLLRMRAHDQYSQNVAMLDASNYGEVRVTIKDREGTAVKNYTETFHTARFDLDIGREHLGCEVSVEGRWRNTNDKIASWGPAVNVVLS
ncbi:hypothetical protein FACS1894137_18990 [Spirochaetia bacterium]|nr:hypothetical protein FACS1894137_18990 [Spirochaetia bacterium]